MWLVAGREEGVEETETQEFFNIWAPLRAPTALLLVGLAGRNREDKPKGDSLRYVNSSDVNDLTIFCVISPIIYIFESTMHNR